MMSLRGTWDLGYLSLFSPCVVFFVFSSVVVAKGIGILGILNHCMAQYTHIYIVGRKPKNPEKIHRANSGSRSNLKPWRCETSMLLLQIKCSCKKKSSWTYLCINYICQKELKTKWLEEFGLNSVL